MADVEENLKNVSAYISKLPALPVTVSKILEIANDPDSSAVDINKIVNLDPVLMARVLRLINSAYYGVANRVTSLVRAIIMLGINTVKNLALSAAVMENFEKNVVPGPLNMNDFWLHSLAVGVLSKMLARAQGVDSRILEEYFIAGLLHDIGKIPLNNALGARFAEAISRAEEEHVALYRMEKELIGFDHAHTGFLIGSDWNFSGEILDAIQNHHTPDSFAGDNIPFVYTISVADIYINTNCTGFSGSRYPEPPPEKAMDCLGINLDNLEAMHTKLLREIEKAKIFLNIGEG